MYYATIDVSVKIAKAYFCISFLDKGIIEMMGIEEKDEFCLVESLCSKVILMEESTLG